jgi:hypothetical protein
MSGFVRIRFERRRIARRSSRGVSQETPALLCQLARLVLRERLGRVEVEGARPWVARERVEHRQVEGERLAAGRAGGDDRVALPR